MPRTIAVCLVLVVSGCGPFVFGPPPRIEAFAADAATVGWGDPLQLRWHVSLASEVSLSGVGRVGLEGAVVRPVAAQSYVLTARGLGGVVVSQPIAITLGPSLAVAAGVMTDGGAPGSIFVARLRSAAGAAPSDDVLVTISADAPGFPLRTLCAAHASTCELRAPSVAPAQTFSATATLTGTKVTTRFALAPGALDPAQGIAASPDGVSWSAVRGAVAYRVQAMDLDSAEPAGAAMVVRATSAALPVTASGVWVEALAAEPADASVVLPAPHVSRATGFASAGRQGGAGAAWQIFSPADFQGDVLHADFGKLGADEHLAVLLINASGPDRADAQVDVSGTASPAAPARSPALVAAARPVDASHDLSRSVQDALLRQAISEGVALAPEPSEILSQTSFCTARGLSTGDRVRKAASLVLATPHGLFYVDDEDSAHYPASFWATIGPIFEERIYPVDTRVFGAESDVDRNGKLTLFFTHELGAHLDGGWLIGYFGNNDLLRVRDQSRDCSGTASNHADILYMNDIANGQANGYGSSDLAGSVFPATIAHELQHLINLNQRCLLRACTEPEATWVNEGLSKVAEDLTGFGWNGAQGRWEGAQYLARAEGALKGYDGRSLTAWEGDPIGNYQAAHSFMRYFTDRSGGSFAGNLTQQAGLTHTLGMPLPRALAEWATALLFSNETSSPLPSFSFSGTGWSPFHARLRYLDYRDLSPGGAVASLRADGFGAFVSGAGLGAAARITVRSSAAVKPHVVVVKFSGVLPR